jgi:hypothetical protein
MRIETIIGQKTLIRLAFRQTIDANSQSEFAKDVFRDSYEEFLIQVQSFDAEGRYTTWNELRKQFPKANLNVNYKTAFAIGLYVKQLSNQIPDVVDNLGQSLAFESYRFEIVESSISDRSKHKVALTFETPTLQLNALLGEYMVLSLPQAEQGDSFTIQMQPGMAVVKFQTSEPFL